MSDPPCSDRCPALYAAWCPHAWLRANEPSSLLRLASALHRRNADIVNASLQNVAGGSAEFVVTVRATEAQVRTLALSLAGVIGVLETGACEVSGA